MWAGARHWPRQTDTPLDLEAEDFSGWDSTPNESGRSGGEVGRQTFAAADLQKSLQLALQVGMISSITNGETKTCPTVTGTNPNTVMLIFIHRGLVSGVAINGVAATSLLNTFNGTRQILVVYNPPAGSTMTFTTTGTAEVAYAALLYENIDIALSARTALEAFRNDVYEASSIDDIVLAFNTTDNANLAGGTQRARVSDTRDLTIDEIVDTTGSVALTYNARPFEIYLTHLVAAPLASASIEEEATLAVAAPKFGQFNALAWVRGESDSAYSLYLSTEYGGVERGPEGTFRHARIEQADAGDWVVRDIGSLSVPHGGLPDGADLGPLTLKLNGVATTPGLSADVDLDWDRVLLLPVEGGSAYVEKPSATDHVVLDTLSDAPGAYLWASASEFKGQPKYRGGAIYVHPRGTRIYLASDRSGDARPADGWTVTAKVVPRYLMI